MLLKNKKKLFLFNLILIQVICFGQKLNQKVGSNPTVLHPSAALEVESTSKGLLPPRMTQAQINAVNNPATGLLIYCTNCSTPGLYVYNGSSWGSITDSNSATSVLVSCSSNAFTGNFYNGVALQGNKFSVTITNNSFTTAAISFQTSDLVLSGVSGISVTAVSIPSVTLNSGQSQVVEYTLSGVPSSTGTLIGAWSKLALNCTKTVVVTNTAIATLDCGGATSNGTLTSGAAASGVTSVVAYTGANGGTYNGQSIASTGITGLTATLAAGNFASGNGSLTFNITGTPLGAGTASFAITIGGKNCTLTRTVNFPAETIASLDCGGASSNGTLTSGTAASGVTSVVAYTGANGGTYNEQSIASTGITGLTATLAVGTLATGTGSLTFTITGTPSGAGTASFAITIGGQNCTLTRTVNLPAGTIAALDCGGATSNGTLTSGSAASGVTSVVAYTGANGGTYNEQSIASTGITGLTATLAVGTLATGTGSLTFTITGTPSGAGTASFAITIGGQNCTLTRTVNLPAGTIAALDCGGAISNGTLTSGAAASGVTSVVAYTGGNGGTYNGQTIASTGVTGLTATLTAGTLATGTGSLTFTITGTPSGAGTASFAITIGGQNCTLTRTVGFPITIPSNLALAQIRTYIITSVYDQDYLPYVAPTVIASTNTQLSDGINESVTVNVQGTITISGITVKIPVTAAGSGTLPAYSQTITIPANMTEDGMSRNLTLSWLAQAYTTSTTTINATIAAVGGTFNAKKLDINAGVGNDALGVLMGQFTYPYNNAGNTTTFSVRCIAGIPDKLFGLPDNNNNYTHRMLYAPVLAEDGNIWLNNNLGAHYATINHPDFNHPAQQATSATDYMAYGSLFQWGRKPDGHELTIYTSSTAGTSVNGTTATLNNAPTNALFIVNPNPDYDWRTSQNDNLWATAASANNPCPTGYRVPTTTELTNLLTAASITNSVTAASSLLKFTVPGLRTSNTGLLYNIGNVGYYWSTSNTNGTRVISRVFDPSEIYNNSSYRADGCSVRCIKD